MKKYNEKLELISLKTIRAVSNIGVVLPSDYLKEFSLQMNIMAADNIIDFDLEEEIKIELNNDLTKTLDLIKSMQSSIGQVVTEFNKIINNTNLDNNDCIEKSKKIIEKLQEKIITISEEIYQDDITTAMNRRWFFQEFLYNERSFKHDGAIAILKIDSLHDINQSICRSAGDKSIAFVVDFIKNNSDMIVIRTHGGELILINNDVEKEVLDKKLTSLINEIKQKKFKVKQSERNFNISCSFIGSNFKKDDNISSIFSTISEVAR
jgi:GGDEF domain-containing protein